MEGDLKVFISWSGQRSKEIANALREWLPMVLQYVKPFVSDKDISAGDRWAQKIAGELEGSNFGIICITPENFDSEWILFEAGALSKSMLEGKVVPLLFGLEVSDFSGPLSQFQALKLEESGIMDIVKSINKVADSKASDQIVDQLVPTLWPQLQETLSNISAVEPTEQHKRPSHEILEELVTGVRGLNSRMRSFDPEMFEMERHKRRSRRRFHPAMIEELSFMGAEFDDEPTALLILAGFLREDFPWLAEIMTESYREIKAGSPKEAERTVFKLRHMVKHLTRHPMMRDMGMTSKESMMLIDDLPMVLEMTLDRIVGRKMGRKAIEADEHED